MSFDHGILNVPLAKRGNIDKQIDAYKREVAAAKVKIASDHSAKLRELRPQAKALVEAIPSDRLSAIAIRAGCSPAAARKRLLSDAHWQPARVIAALAPKEA